MQNVTNNEQETKECARTFAKSLELGNGPVILLLHGDLGAGKTTFVQGLAEGLGVEAQLTSPTFTVVQEYLVPDGRTLYHMDAYRLDETTDLEALGFHDMTTDQNALVAIEWPEKIPQAKLEGATTIDFSEIDKDKREISIAS